ncbi:MAG: hypothetical protein PVI23_06025 [Maricaulaceae bacterium]|jgi:hypothetical protein
MIEGGIESDDIETLAEILEREHKAHRRKCSVCFAMFLLAFSSLVVALVLVGVRLAIVISSPVGAEALGLQFALFQVLAPLTAVALSFFGAWWAAQNCLNSMERALCAARNKRQRLFETFLGQIQCAGKEKQRAWLEIVKSAVM